MHKYHLPTYIISLPERDERRKHALREFEGKTLFDVHVFPAIKHERGAVGLWRSIVEIVAKAKKNKDDAILICEDDHTFTPAYDESCFIQNLFRAAEYGAQVLLGGIGNVRNAVPVCNDMMWIDWFWCTQFMVVYSTAYDDILNANFDEHFDVADEFLSKILSNKLVFFPFISEQHDFGYSDVTMSNNRHGTIGLYFEKTAHKLKAYQRIFNKYGLVKQFKKEVAIVQHPYLTSTTEPKLHLGCGNIIKQGWLNVDINPVEGAERMDASKHFPFPNESFKYIYSEHLIEHLNYIEGRNMLDECYRILRKGGILRIATPSLESILDIYTHPKESLHSRYISWSNHKYAPWLVQDFYNSEAPACLLLNNIMHLWGHKLIYDKETLTAMLRISGFEKIRVCRIGQSEIACFKGAEQHGRIIPNWANELETMVLEVVK